MPQKISAADASYFLGFDGGGTKTECVLADKEGRVLTRATAGPSNPFRTGYTRAWFALSDAADLVLSRQKVTSSHIRGVCAGLGGAGRSGVARRVATFLRDNYPNAKVCVTTDLEIALEAAFGSGEGLVLHADTGSAAFGRDANGRTARAGGRGPWFSDEGSAFDIGRRAIRAVSLAEENRGPATELAARIFACHQCHGWDSLLDSVARNPDDVFPKTYPLVAELADKEDAVARQILSAAAVSLAELATSVANELGWRNREVGIARVGGMYGRSQYFDAAIERELKTTVPQGRLVSVDISPAEAAVRKALRLSRPEGNVA
jgi:N-acetylglucosamine kinase-like BadF-type ATPase